MTGEESVTEKSPDQAETGSAVECVKSVALPLQQDAEEKSFAVKDAIKFCCKVRRYIFQIDFRSGKSEISIRECLKKPQKSPLSR